MGRSVRQPFSLKVSRPYIWVSRYSPPVVASRVLVGLVAPPAMARRSASLVAVVYAFIAASWSRRISRSCAVSGGVGFGVAVAGGNDGDVC